jgi:hypothetical protein
LLATAPELGFHSKKSRQHRLRPAARLDKGDSIAVLRPSGIGPGGGAPPAGSLQHAQSCLGKARQGRLEERFRRGERPGKVAAEGHDDRLVQADTAGNWNF